MGMAIDDQGELRVSTPFPYEEALERTKAALKEQGFGVLSEIHIDQALKEKIGVDFRRYTILGACNPTLAHQALQQEVEIGLRLPCNTIVYPEGANTVVSVMDPMVALGQVDIPTLRPVAEQARAKLVAAVDALRAAR
ncbi:MAG TPA: DUF302 domain-containing protein [Armatimonadota bacterium]|jgi:uncharacterized protein (DUF302 family)